MTTATLTSKGQITIPKQVRDQLHLSTGDRVRFLADGEGRIVMVPATISIAELRGCLPAPSHPVTLAEMDEAIAAGASESIVVKKTRKRKV
jgi:AbrB family looped-hinge helix DNA binding protein